MYMRVLRKSLAMILQYSTVQYPSSWITILLPPPFPSYLLFSSKKNRANNSPLRQAQQQVLLCALREASNPEPAHAPVAILVLGASADAHGVLDHVAASRRRVYGGRVGQAADELHLCERAGSGGREGAGAGAREGGAEGEHYELLCLVGFGGLGDGCVFVLLLGWFEESGSACACWIGLLAIRGAWSAVASGRTNARAGL